ncbi:hypothetical protein XH96_03855 [Bradyrhizobium sp. CCBAU 51765]|nr:hypothetical protein XH96_03855 [Bradyrhizobium sp. CCBAU 51765]
MGTDCIHGVMAGLDPAIHAFSRSTKNVDARDKPGHDDLCKIQTRLPCRREEMRGARNAAVVDQW